ncbi:hypothetical protein KC957_03520 [Candidatus Saccharibacteria bacterium]|nr:hypothetical protein [Candidatus Saccharibacteria bacterium]
MSRNPFSNKTNTGSESYSRNNPGKRTWVLVVVLLVVLMIGVPIFVTLRNKPDKYTQSATEAVRKEIPNAKVTDVRVAGGFAIATVSDPTAKSQIRAGNVTILKVNEDGSMTLIANGSSFSPLDLLELGIPLDTQAQLRGTEIDQVMQSLESACGYNHGDAPGYNGFNGSFNPDMWEIDSGSLGNIERALTASVSNSNARLQPSEKVTCVNVTKNNSNATTDTKTYISTFSLELQFITGGGEVTTHMFTFSIGPKYYRAYTLDGQPLQDTLE